MKRPNIIYFVCHDLGKHLGCYGAGTNTPNLDRLAAEGALIEKMVCNSPACSPSRGCAMTGQYAHTNGLMGLVNTGWSMPLETRTIVDELNDAGYETAHIGFQHERHKASENRYAVEMYEGFEDSFIENAVAKAIRYIESRDASKPFYLNIGTLEVHGTQWQGSMEKNPRRAVFGERDPATTPVPDCWPDLPKVREGMAALQSCVEYMDAQIGALLDVVEQMDDTLFIFTTDHGLPGCRGKGTLYIHGVEIACIARMPSAIERGRRYSELLQNIDVVPTLLEAAGVPVPERIQGRSFWPLITGGTYVAHDKIFLERTYHGGLPLAREVPPGSTEGYDPMRSVRTPKYTYIRNFDPDAKREPTPEEVTEVAQDYNFWFNEILPKPSQPRDAEELFDLASDPMERRNVADDPEYAHVRAELAAALDTWMSATDDPILRGHIPDRANPWPGHFHDVESDWRVIQR